ncbi:aminoacylase-1-like isoform X2 [Sitodiplosis mosellana]|uniref:aminoacylase-1-like isoform X2 n=1 Tax=Sitodiplosis mosellana TaxID=263140 RepID=UPI002443C83A|nr:aminoacylase-1-like isoform X2 [Sitodiplosis mosellana]
MKSKTIFTNPSLISRYVCNIRFLVVAAVCVLIIAGTVYFSHTENESINKELPFEKPTNGKPDIEKENNDTLPGPSKWENNEEIQIFREYLQIPSVHPDIDYEPCVAFLKKQAEGLNLPVKIYYPVNDKNPIVVLTWEGSKPELPTIVLNSHMDVVPVYEEYWKYPPFSAHIDESGNIFARGAQDMKSVGMQYLAALRALKRDGVQQLKRTIHVIYVPDEERGGVQGMAGFVKSSPFKSINLAFALDEGGVAINNEGVLPVYYAERTIWQIEFIFHGHSGHGSKLFDDTPGEKLSYVVSKFMEFRRGEVYKLNQLKYPYGNVTTINLTKIKGGVENNVIPAEMSATFDIRISINTDLDEFEKMIHRWCKEAGGNITVTTLEKGEKEKVTPVDDSNPYWIAFRNAVHESGLKVQAMVLGPSSDMKYIRRIGLAALGFSPLMNTVAKLHDHNEYISVDTYLAGVNVYKKIILNLGNV